jgi:hypothetical protein
MKKSIFTKIIALTLFIGLSAGAAKAQTWTVGNGVTATLAEGTLTVSGTGAMNDYNSGSQPYFSSRNSIQSVLVEAGVTHIGNYAFYQFTNLSSISMSDGLLSIGNYAFSGCTALSSISLSEGLLSIGNNAFYGCTALSSISLPEGLLSIGNYAFYGCTSPVSLYIPNSVQTIGASAFYVMTSLDYVLLGTGLKSIGVGAFSGCSNLTTVRFNATDCRSFDFGASNTVFYSCPKLKTFMFGSGVKSIPDNMFNGITHRFNLYHQSGQSVGGSTYLGDIQIPPSVEYIGANAFKGVTMDKLMIPASVDTICASAFQNCSSLEEIYCNKSTAPILNGNLVFHNVDKGTCLLVVPSNAYNAYASAAQWQDFVFIVDPTYFSTSLMRITVNSDDVDGFDSGTYSYSLTVPYEVESITLNAEAESTASTVIGTGTFDLNVGLNVFVITVISANGLNSNIYTIGVTRLGMSSGIEESIKQDFNIFVDNNSDLHITGEELGNNATVHIFTVTGKTVYNSPFVMNSAISVSHLPSGIYIVKAGNRAEKFVKR